MVRQRGCWAWVRCMLTSTNRKISSRSDRKQVRTSTIARKLTNLRTRWSKRENQQASSRGARRSIYWRRFASLFTLPRKKFTLSACSTVTLCCHELLGPDCLIAVKAKSQDELCRAATSRASCLHTFAMLGLFATNFLSSCSLFGHGSRSGLSIWRVILELSYSKPSH